MSSRNHLRHPLGRSWRSLLSAALLALLAIPAGAQRSTELSAMPRNVPLHELRLGANGPVEIWAMGPGYKASFHDGFAFYPRLGSEYSKNLPLHWRTLSIACGEKELLDAEANPSISHTDWRCELDYGGIVEAYVVGERGVEQRFVFAGRPAGGGDLVVTGAISTELVAAETDSVHDDLEFCGPRNRALVNYGRAFVFDASGAKAPITTSHVTGQIQLRVPASWLDKASWPVTIDPLTSPILTGYSTYGPTSDPEVAMTRLGNQDHMLMIYRTHYRGDDWDCYAKIYDAHFGGWVNIFYDVSDRKVGSCAAAFVASTRRWVMAYEDEDLSNHTSRIAIYDYALGDRGQNSGYRRYATAPGGFNLRQPDLGGTEDGSAAGGDQNALLVFEAHTRSGTATVEAWGVRINTASHTISPPSLLAGSAINSGGARSQPNVNQVNSGFGSSWIVAWQERPSAGSAWRVRGNRIRADGSRVGTTDLGPAFSGMQTTRPRVAGSDGRYVLTCGVGTDATGKVSEKIYSRRFDWHENQWQPTFLATRLLVSGSMTSPYTNEGLAYDYTGRSHWAMVFTHRIPGQRRVEAARLGYTGGVVEWNIVAHYPVDDAFEPSISFDRNGRFPLVYATSKTPPSPQFQYPIYGQFLVYNPAAQSSKYGVHCSTGQIGAKGRPYAGNQYFDVTIEQAPANAQAFLFAAPLKGQLSLTPMGMPGCYLLLNAQTIFPVASVQANGSGYGGLRIPLPDAPAMFGDIYLQWLYLQSNGARSTQGLHVAVR